MKTTINYVRHGVCLLAVLLLWVAVPLAKAENPLTDRCSGHVFISSSYSDSDAHNIARGTGQGFTIERDNSYWDQAPSLPDNWVGPWSPWISITQTKDRYVRWYCFEALYQTTGLGISCETFNSCDDNHNRPTGFKDVGTAERSRCDFEPKSVRVRIEKQRKFEIECSGESAASNGDALTKANSPPTVTIKAPANNTTVAFGALNSITFEAVATDFEDSNCCKMVWTSDVDGQIGIGAEVIYTFPTSGPRKIAVQAFDSAGAASVSASINILATNLPPSVKINKPALGATLYRNVTYLFDGQGTDPNQPAFTLPCASLSWSTNVAGDPQPAGCNPNLVFKTIGPRWLTLTGTDAQGLHTHAATLFDVVDPPAGSGPFVTITNPIDGSAFVPYQSSLLSYTVSNAASGLAPAPVWKIEVGGQQIPVNLYAPPSPGLAPTWTPSDYLHSTCGTSSATLWLYFVDGSGKTASDHVKVGVNYGPC